MRYFIVYAHPEPRSLNGSLKDAAVQALTQAGQLLPEVVREIENLKWADVVVLQFPLWWFGPPAILKGWFDRVLVNGFAIGVPSEATRQWLRYGEGLLQGRRGILAVTTGGREAQFSGRGINGPINDILFPINHGIFHYTGMKALAPFVAFRTVRTTPEEFLQMRDRYVARLLAAGQEVPMAYRFENGGDYDETGRLCNDLGEGSSGFQLHLDDKAGAGVIP